MVTGDRRIIGHGHDRFGVDPFAPEPSLLVTILVHPAVEHHRIQVLGPGIFPRVAVPEPVVRGLGLVSLYDLLEEDAVLVPDAVAVRGELQGGHGIHEAGGEPAQAAVPETRVPFHLAKLLHVIAQLHERPVTFHHTDPYLSGCFRESSP